MLKDIDVIEYNFTEDVAKDSIREAFKYAVMSIPFTINRMELEIEERIKNIIKGKYAEYVFFSYLQKQNLPYEPDSTPYYQVDLFDFKLGDYFWDIKNNYLHCDYLAVSDILNCYGLIPNRHNNDQWQKFRSSNNRAIIFTFMYYYEINVMDENLIETLKKFVQKYKGKPQDKAPIDFQAELEELLTKRKNFPVSSIDNKRKMYITGYILRDSPIDCYFEDLEPGSSFPEGVNCITTRIKNKGIKIEYTYSFLSFIKNLESKEL